MKHYNWEKSLEKAQALGALFIMLNTIFDFCDIEKFNFENDVDFTLYCPLNKNDFDFDKETEYFAW